MLIQQIVHIEFTRKIVSAVVGIRRIVALLAAVGRNGVVAVAVPVVAVARGVAQPEFAITVTEVEIEIQSVDNKACAVRHNASAAQQAFGRRIC